jgi:hypothetical protein
MKNLILFLMASALMFSSCKSSEVATPNYNGAEQVLGNGKIYSWLKVSADDKPTSIGVTLTKGALDNLSHSTFTEIVVPLSTTAVGKTPFDHVFLSFSHSGHEPAGIYDVAHFDMHFVIQPLAERNAIPPYTTATAAKFDNLPVAGSIPPPYFRLPAGVPLMGVHWANPTSPELNGGKFTETFIMGSYDGKMTFYEPMITLDFLNSKPNITKSAPVPTKFPKAGYYPMKYSIKQVGDNIEISLDEMMLMQ